jgi:transcriptional regulator with XRE-family HTH domain
VEKLARRIKTVREARGLSQQALADKAGVSRGYLARLEGGHHDPTVGTVAKLARALGVKLIDLLS